MISVDGQMTSIPRKLLKFIDVDEHKQLRRYELEIYIRLAFRNKGLVGPNNMLYVSDQVANVFGIEESVNDYVSLTDTNEYGRSNFQKYVQQSLKEMT